MNPGLISNAVISGAKKAVTKTKTDPIKDIFGPKNDEGLSTVSIYTKRGKAFNIEIEGNTVTGYKLNESGAFTPPKQLFQLIINQDDHLEDLEQVVQEALLANINEK